MKWDMVEKGRNRVRDLWCILSKGSAATLEKRPNSQQDSRALESTFRNRFARWLPCALLVASWLGNLRAEGPPKIWELDLKKAFEAEHLPRDQSYKVMGLSFSPDAQQIAVRLLDKAVLIRAQDPTVVIGKFPNLIYHDSFGWSPDSQTIHSGGHVVHLADGTACDLPGTVLVPGFISNDRLPARVLDSPYPLGRDPRPTAPLRLYGADCKERDSWEVPRDWLINDVSAKRGLLSVWEVVPALPYGHTELIVSPLTKSVIRSRSVAYGPIGWFADRGSALCGANLCWDVDNAQVIGQAPGSGKVASASEVAGRSSRVVLDDPHTSGIPFSSTFTEMSARRMVWDFRSGKTLVSWKLKFITYSTSFDLDGYNRDRKPIPCAISPDGAYVVEGGDGKIWLYKIQP